MDNPSPFYVSLAKAKGIVNFLPDLHTVTCRALREQDPEALNIVESEKKMRARTIPLVASENYMSSAVALATGVPDLGARNMESNQPGVPFYQGEVHAQAAQELAIRRATELFGCAYANVQPFSGSTANFAVGKALAAKLGRKPRVMSLSMAQGGHFTHGSDGNAMKDICEDVTPYFVQDVETAEAKLHEQYALTMHNVPPHGKELMVAETLHQLDYDAIEEKLNGIAKDKKPDVIIVGGSAYPRAINFQRMKKIAHEHGALLWADVAHYAGLIAGKQFTGPFVYEEKDYTEQDYAAGVAELVAARHLPEGEAEAEAKRMIEQRKNTVKKRDTAHQKKKVPVPELSADIVTSTTHKSLRGPRGGIILWNDPGLTTPINEAVFPGIQGEPHPGQMLGKAVAFEEAMSTDFRDYAMQVCKNAKTLAHVLTNDKNPDRAFKLITGGTDSHMVNIDLRPLDISGKEAAEALERIGLITNKMPIPGDDNPDYSGLRIGTPAATTLHLKETDFEQIGKIVKDVLHGLKTARTHPEEYRRIQAEARDRVSFLCERCRFEEEVGLTSAPSHRRPER